LTVPDPQQLAELLDEHAPLSRPALCPELCAFSGRSLVALWEAAERLAGHPVPSPFWAYPWPGGIALARVLLDHPEWVRGRRVLDFGAGGGIASLAAARAGANHVVANDMDPWALVTAQLAARRQGLHLTPLLEDLTARPAAIAEFQVVLCGDLAYERAPAPAQRQLLEHARESGALVLVADAGRAYFDTSGMQPIASFRVDVPQDLEGVSQRTTTVYKLL
jgi:predicted nicotinamide N-methyase